MTVGELIERLEDLDPNAEVRLMTQRHDPMESHVRGVCDNVELFEEDANADYKELDLIVYIVEGEQIGYGRKAAWQQAS